MRLNRVLTLGASALVLLSACTAGGGSPSASSAPVTNPPASVTAPSAAPPSAAAPPAIRIGSDNFYESKLMAEIYAQALEAKGYKVERHLGLGSRQERAPAMEAGQVDLVPEYVGSGLGYYDKSKITGDGQKNADALNAIVATKGGGMTVLNIAPAQDQNAFVVRKETATTLSLAKMSQLAAVQDQLKWGLPPDCDKNPLCKGALVDSYGIKYPPKVRKALAACDAPMATALQAKSIDLAELCSTQPAISQFGFVVLEDDKQSQPAENLAPLVRNDYLAKLSDKAAFEKILNDVSAKMDTPTLTRLGVDVAVNNKDIKDVAKQWLTDNSLL